MSRTWTEKQYEAITAEGDLLVSAAAGAGKTAVLTERIARLISEGVRVEELLVVTFTKAAASEMKARIEARLYELAAGASASGRDEDSARLLRAAASCERANISTIHSFCMNVLRRNYHEAGMDPGAAVADSTRAELLASAAMDEVLENAFDSNEKQPDADLKALLTAVGNDDKLAVLIRRLYDHAAAKPEPDEWLDMAVRIYGEGFTACKDRITGDLIEHARRELQTHFDTARALRLELPEEYTGARAALSEDMDTLLALMIQPDYESFRAGLFGIALARLSWPRGTDEDIKQPYKYYRTKLKDCLNKFKKLFAFSLEDEARFAAKLAGPVACLRRLVGEFGDKFSSLKAEEGLIDYTDMEQLTLRVLKNPAIAEEYRQRFKYVFIDEYQDINPAQEAILAAVSQGNRFMVGDVKQSIYRFRQAEPAIFLEKYNTYDGSGGRRRIDLNRNFRSDNAILESANHLFSQLMRGEDVGEIDYADNAALVSGREGEAASGLVRLVIIEQSGKEKNDLNDEATGEALEETADSTAKDAGDGPEDEAAEEDAAAVEAAYAARRILDMMASFSINEGGVSRRCRWSDFAVLLRSAKSVARRWLSVLSDAGIPCVSTLGGGFFEAVEVRVFMDLLRIIDNRRQDIPLLAVMRSHIYSFTDEELIHIRADYEGEDMLDRVTAAAADGKQPNWSIKCRRLLEDTERWRQLSRLMSVDELIGLLLDETGFEAYCAALSGGEARSANLQALWERARHIAANGGYGLAAFISYMDEAKAQASMEAAQTPYADAVRLMTVHGSKGLEFPIVFLAGVTKRFNMNFKRDVGIFDPELGIGLCSVYGDRSAKCLLQRAIAYRESVRLTAEEMRLLYVAQTRAKHALYMLGAKKDAAKYAAEHMRPLNEASVMNARCYADWLLGAYLPHGGESGTAVRLEGGAEIGFYIEPAPQTELAARGMSQERFDEWRQEAAFADCSSVEAKFKNDYPMQKETELPSKLSVTGLALHNMPAAQNAAAQAAQTVAGSQPVQLRERPRFMQDDKPLTGADIGTLTHRLMQLISIRPHTAQSIEAELAALTAKGAFTETEAQAIRKGAVLQFFSSDLGQRLIASPRVEREKEFNLMMEANRLISSESAAPIMLQGVIDCCFIEDGAWVLIDHKTTRVEPNRTARTVAEQYRRQLELYAEALERLTGIPVRQKYVYMLSAGEAVELK